MRYKVHTIVQKRRKTRLIKFIVAIISLIAIFVSGVVIMRSEFLRLKTISVQGNVVVSTDEIMAESQRVIFNNYLYLFPKNNILTLPKSSLKSSLLQKFPRIEDLVLDLNGYTLSINIKERKPDSLWCGLSFSETIDPCLFVDESGYVFSKAPQFDGSSFVKFCGAGMSASTTAYSIVISTSTSEISLETFLEQKQAEGAWRFITSDEYANLKVFMDNLKGEGINIDSVELDNNGGYIFQMKNNGVLMILRVADEKGVFGGNLASSFENLKAGLGNKAMMATSTSHGTSQIDGSKIADFEYIDLRYGNKIFYKKR